MKRDKKKPSRVQKSELQKADKERQQSGGEDGSLPEFYGPKGPEPTRYGDWEQKGRCTDF